MSAIKIRSSVKRQKLLVKYLDLPFLAIAAAMQFTGAMAATPGLPFTEDFSNNNVRGIATDARWSTAQNALFIQFRRAQTLGLVTASSIPSDITGDTYNTQGIAMADLNADGHLDIITGNDGSPARIYFNTGVPESPFGGVVGEALSITSGNYWFRSIDVGDVDLDGDLDIVIARYNSPNLLYLNQLNAGSSAPFTSVTPLNITSDADSSQSIKLAYIDNDNYLDVVVGNTGNFNKYYINGGAGTLFSALVTGAAIDNDNNSTSSIAVVDIDNDGDIDVVAGNSGQTNKYYLNNGSGFTGGAGTAISSNAFYTKAIAAADVNNDGFIDVVAGNGVAFGGGQANYVYLNNTTATPFSAATVGNAISTEADTTFTVKLNDVDGDGDLDLITANYEQRDKIYLNNGTSTPFASATGINISNDSLLDNDLALGDIDGDGDIDIVVGTFGSNRLYQNGGTSKPFSRGIAEDVSTDSNSTWALAYGDVNNDGHLDVISGNASDPNYLYINNGTDSPFTGVPGMVIAADLSSPRAMQLDDMNGDGKLDLLVGNSVASRIYIHDGSATPYAIGVSLGVGALEFATGDINGDGHPDLVAGTSSGQDQLFINNGTATPFSAVVGAPFGVAGSTAGLALGDLNNDGKLDLAQGTYGVDYIYLNNGSGTPFSTSAAFEPASKNTSDVQIVDFNNDGALDIIAGRGGAVNQLYLNDGVGNPFDTTGGVDLGTDAFNTLALAVGDINRDGLLDVIASHFGGQHVRLYLGSKSGYVENEGIDVSNDSLSSRKVAVADFNGDGDLDVLAGVQGINRLYHNDAAPEAFNTIVDTVIGTTNYYTVPINVGDFNQDGLLDVIGGVWGGTNKLNINNGTKNPYNQAAQNLGTDALLTQALAVGDINRDGLDDVVSGNNGGNNLLHLNNGTPTPFTGAGTNVSNVAETDVTRDLVLADLNRDGYLDVIAGNQGINDKIYFHSGNPSSPYGVAPTSVYPINFNTRVIRAADIDNDGDIDLVTGNDSTVSGDNTGGNAVFLNNGSGGFPLLNGYYIEFGFDSVNFDKDNSYGLAIGDVNNDGLPDLVVGNYGSVNKLYLNDGSAKPFYNTSSIDIGVETDNTRVVTLNDFDQDGDLDLIVANFDGTDKYYLNSGTAVPFSAATVGVPVSDVVNTSYAVASADVDNDGNVDLIIADSVNADHFYRSLPFDVEKNKAFSNEVDTDTDILKATLTPTLKEVLPTNTSIKWFMTNNGWTTYFQVQPGVEFTFPVQGNDLRWRSEFSSLSPKNTPTVDTVTITARLDHDLDFVADDVDICVGTYDPAQLDNDADGVPGVSTGPITGGDACDIDDDNDGIGDVSDLFPFNPLESADTDGDCGAIDYNLPTSGNGCGDFSDPDIDDDGIPNISDPFMFNVAPSISGSPAITATPNTPYVFTPVISDGGDGPSLTASLTFSGGTQANLPAWLSFNTTTGALSGVPSNDDYGVIANIIITIDDGLETASLASFDINVIDTRAPQTFAVPGTGNFNEDAVVTLACFESIGSGCANIHYTTDDLAAPAAFTIVSSQTTLITIPSSAGNANLRFYSDDADGNTESIQIETYNFDLNYPVVSITTPADGSILTTVNSIDGSSSDVGTGIADISIQITDGTNSVQTDGGSLLPGTPVWISLGPVVGAWSYDTTGLNWTSDTVYTITARASDNAGNTVTTSLSYTYFSGTPSTTTLDLSLTNTSIAANQTTDAFFTLTRLNNLYADLTGIPLALHITKPDASVVTVNGTTNYTGNLTLSGLGDGVDILFDTAGVYSMVAEFTDTTTYPNLAASTSNPISLLVGTSAGYAIIVQGKLSNEEGLDSHNKTANRIYKTFKDRGFADEDIFYFNYDANQTGVDGVPDKATIQKLIEGSANGITDPQLLQDLIPNGLAAEINSRPAPVYLVMVDHGGKAVDSLEARFYMNDEEILPSELNLWLGSLEANMDALDVQLKVDNNRIVIIGACYSGGFISDVAGDGRIVITSATENEPSYKGPIEDDGIRVGEYFLEELFLELGEGNNLRDAFKIATNKTESYTKEASGDTSTNSDNEFLDIAVQHPLLDDNADGAGTNAIFDNSADGLNALDVVLGFDQSSLTNDAFIPADVDSVSGAQYLDNATSNAVLTMYANDPSQVNQAYVEIRTPQTVLIDAIESTTEQLTSDFIRRAYIPPVAAGQPYTLDYTEFVEAGKYEIFSYVNDRFTGALSSAKRSIIYKNRANTAPTADDVDGINDAPTAFNLLTPTNGDTGPYITGFTWSASTDPDLDTVSYSFYLADDTSFTTFTKDTGDGSCTQQNEPYVQEELTGPGTFVDAVAGLCDGRTYFWKVEAIDPYGLHVTSSNFSYTVSNNLNADIGVIVAMVKSATTNQQLTAANITNGAFGESAIASANVLYNGNYVLFTSNTGVGQTVTATLGSYAAKDVVIGGVASGQTVEILFDMSPDAALDTDGDGVVDISDNCPSPAPDSINADQADFDSDGLGDVCDDDDDNDGIPDTYENGYAFLNPLFAGDAVLDQDGDTINNLNEYRDGTDPSVFNVIPSDVDTDGIDDSIDNCVNNYNPDQINTDADSLGDVCDPDDDGDGMSDVFELLYGLNPLLNDAAGDLDGDGITNLQEFIDNTDPTTAPGTTTDIDNDGVFDAYDNCPSTTNAGQIDTDGDGAGDACDTDDDNDTYADVIDAFPLDATEWLDTDGDLVGNNTDPDIDGDGVANGSDAFPLDASESVDTDGDLVGNNADGDDDNDGVADGSDAFPLNSAEWLDTDGDLTGNNADLDDDGDGVVDTADAFPLDATETLDTDLDGIGNNTDPDMDGDGVANGSDAFPLIASESVDTDGDLIGNNADNDDDGDGMPDAFELLYSLNPLVNDAAGDPDGDGVTNINEYLGGTNPNVINSDTTDTDGDGVTDVTDNCPAVINATQLDTDGDGAGDACDSDDDNDGVIDGNDAFPLDAAESVDTDGDLIGNNADTDDDGDGVADGSDAFPLDATETVDTDKDGIGDNTDPDIDGDGVANGSDAFPLNPAETLDTDFDTIGNNADSDDDGDGMSDAFEILYGLNPLVDDANGDADGDGVINIDEFTNGTNPMVVNSDTIDTDGDGVLDIIDNCPAIQNGVAQDNQLDTDADGTGNACDPDDDNDNVLDGSDLFPTDATESADFDGDGTGDNADTDDDNDGMSDAFETLYSLDSKNAADATGDADGDGVTNLDEYLAGTNPNVINSDTIDTDLDGVKDFIDNCPAVANGVAEDNQLDTDGDSVGNACDPDDDNDSILDASDLFPLDTTESADFDGDGIGNNADTDDDNDGMSDDFEILYALNPFDAADAADDNDADGVNNLQEFQAGTSPLVSNAVVSGTSAPTSSTSSNSSGSLSPLFLLALLINIGLFGWWRNHRYTRSENDR
ncbi:MAG: FG-GAP-like repeat-containing protein [Gammaproteobacteria bacterium]|nr:FG-GAP-like repeat-containing protein [Gammaproteobacteria bacterium]